MYISYGMITCSDIIYLIIIKPLTYRYPEYLPAVHTLQQASVSALQVRHHVQNSRSVFQITGVHYYMHNVL